MFRLEPCLAQHRSSARQARHHGTDWCTDDGCNLAMRQIVDLAQDDHLSEHFWKRCYQCSDFLSIEFTHHLRLRRVLRLVLQRNRTGVMTAERLWPVKRAVFAMREPPDGRLLLLPITNSTARCGVGGRPPE
jgi:hypothetical protein